MHEAESNGGSVPCRRNNPAGGFASCQGPTRCDGSLSQPSHRFSTSHTLPYQMHTSDVREYMLLIATAPGAAMLPEPKIWTKLWTGKGPGLLNRPGDKQQS